MGAPPGQFYDSLGSLPLGSWPLSTEDESDCDDGGGQRSAFVSDAPDCAENTEEGSLQAHASFGARSAPKDTDIVSDVSISGQSVRSGPTSDQLPDDKSLESAQETAGSLTEMAQDIGTPPSDEDIGDVTGSAKSKESNAECAKSSEETFAVPSQSLSNVAPEILGQTCAYSPDGCPASIPDTKVSGQYTPSVKRQGHEVEPHVKEDTEGVSPPLKRGKVIRTTLPES